MDASLAGLIINNSNNIVISTNIAIVYAIGIFGGGGLIGLILGMAVKFGNGFIDEYFKKRIENRERKVNAAKEINAFCAEGMKTGFRHRPRDQEHILFKANEIEAIDQETGKKIRIFLNSWMQYRDFMKDHPDEIEREKMAIGFRNDAQKYGEELLKVAKIWVK